MTRATARPAGRDANRSPIETPTTRRAAGPATPPAAAAGSGYLAASERPWASFVFLLPLVIGYELYSLGWVGGGAAGPVRHGTHITAFLLIEHFFALLGAAGRHLPAFALTAMLLGAHVVRNDRWRLKPQTLAGMAAESLGWAVPLLVLGWAMARYVPLYAEADASRLVVLCFGAGVYEEMVFRLFGVTVLLLVLKDVLGLPKRASVCMALLSTGVLFSLYHHLNPDEHFELGTFAFRALAGGYFGVLYLLRGFGVTAASHAAYDVTVVMLLP